MWKFTRSKKCSVSGRFLLCGGDAIYFNEVGGLGWLAQLRCAFLLVSTSLRFPCASNSHIEFLKTVFALESFDTSNFVSRCFEFWLLYNLLSQYVLVLDNAATGTGSQFRTRQPVFSTGSWHCIAESGYSSSRPKTLVSNMEEDWARSG